MRLKVSNVCQLLDKSKYPATKTENGITWTNNGDGTITTTGNASNLGAWLNIGNLTVILISSHKYLLCGCPSGGATNTYWLRLTPLIVGDPKDLGNGIIFTAQETTTCYPLLQINPGQGDNLVWKPQLFDLTEMYGAGNEPTTVAQFRQDFPNEMYEYSPVCWKKFRRLKYIANKQPVQLYAKNIWGEGNYNGVSIKNNNDGSITLNGTATQTFFYTNILDYEIKPNHKYLYFDYYPQTPSWDTYVGGCEGKVDHESAVMFAIYNTHNDGAIEPSSPNLPSNTLLNTFCMCYKGFTLNNVTIKPQLFDLTEMYGAGHEPATVAEFRQRFPNELYDYNPYNYLTLNRGKYIANKEPVQLLDKNKFPTTTTLNGVTFTNNGNGVITTMGNASNLGSWLNMFYSNFNITKTHKYLLCGSPAGGSSNTYFIRLIPRIDGDPKDTGEGVIFSAMETAEKYVTLQTLPGSGDNLVWKPQFFDLTEMYGAGNEPTTVAQFKADYPNELYDYNPYNAITFR